RPPDAATLRLLHHTIAAIREDFAGLTFNTAIARLTELTTASARVAARDGALPRGIAEPLVLMVAPLVPHIAEELWQRLGHSGSLAYESFPDADPVLAEEAFARIPVQINGKTRVVVEVRSGADGEETERTVFADPEFARLIPELDVERTIVVPGRIVNIITR
ncbi:MAG TPA: class I tRNA ligase family protein, partial [Streptosporangiaceae bacterium]